MAEQDDVQPEEPGEVNPSLEDEDIEDQDSDVKSRGKEREMSFLDHLEELRWSIIYSFIGALVGAIILWIFKDFIIEDFLLRPAIENKVTLQNLRPFGQVFLYMQVAFFGGIILSIPNIIYQIWRFVAPGLYKHERRYIAGIVVFTSLCFVIGVAFAYYVVLPSAFKFFVAFGTDKIENNISIEEYFNFVLNLMLGAGLVFELPMLSFFLSKLGLVTPKLMRKFWRHAVASIFILSAFLTPGTDPVSMVILAIPLLALYEISVWISKYSQKKRPPPDEEEEDADDPEEESTEE